ncbi:MAG: Gfo/Idh/MocA family oxidoreductase [Oscillospiraceae bacterium]
MISIGIVGAGGMGTVHMANYAHIDGVKVVAVCDTSPAAAERAESFGAKLYAGIEDMLDGEKIDVVDICAPTFAHHELTIAALARGKHVICEKPIALSVANAFEMFDFARKNGVMLFVAHVLQYSLDTMALRRIVTSGEYGKALDAQFLRLSGCPRWVKNGWLFDRKKSGLLPFDLHIHDLDLIVSLFGAPKSYSYTSCGGADKNYKEHYRFCYNYDGMNVSAEASWYNADFPFTAQWRVYFENAVVTSEGGKVTVYTSDGAPQILDTEEKLLIPTGINVPPTGMYLRELNDFIGKIKAGERCGCDRESELLEVLKILETIE